MLTKHVPVATALLYLMLSGCGSSGGAAAGGGGDGGASNAAAGSCKSLAELCKRMPIEQLRTIFSAPKLMAVDGSDLDPPGGPSEMCTFRQDTSDLYVSFNLQYLCASAGAARAQQNFTDVRKVSTATNEESVPGLGDEAYWSFTFTSTVPYVWGYLTARKGAVIATIVSYSQKTPGVPTDTSITPADAKQHATAAVQALLDFATK